MSTVTWSAPSAEGSNLAAAVLDGLASGAESAFLDAYDNSSNKALYGKVSVNLGSITPAAGGQITLRVYNSHAAGAEFDDLSGGAESYTLAVKSGASAKVCIFPMVRLYPWSMKMTITNNTSVAFSASAGSNTAKVTPYGEVVA